MSASSASRKTREAKAKAARAEAERAEKRRRNLWIAGGVAGIVVAVGVVGAIVVTSGSSEPAVTASVTGSTAPPPWPAPTNPEAAIAAAGLRADSQEQLVRHDHSHLDIIVDGKPVVVPAGIGIASSTISELHTHQPDGVIHIEAPDNTRTYTLKQLFGEWDVALSADRIGGLVAGNGKTLTAYVDGKQVTGNPADIELVAHREIALVYGSPNATGNIPSKYAFPAGE